jgi:hypothetical protein
MKNDQAKEAAPKKEIHLNSFTRFLFSLITLFIMLGALPVGVYLVGQRTSFLPEASIKAPPPTGETSLSIEQSSQMSKNGNLAVNILARSDVNHANLFAARVYYPKDTLEVVSVATSSATLPSGINLDNDVKTEFIKSCCCFNPQP